MRWTLQLRSTLHTVAEVNRVRHRPTLIPPFRLTLYYVLLSTATAFLAVLYLCATGHGRGHGRGADRLILSNAVSFYMWLRSPPCVGLFRILDVTKMPRPH